MRILRLGIPLLLFLCIETVHGQTSTHPFKNGFTLSVTESAESGLAGLSLLIYGGTQFENEGQHGTFRLVLDMLMRGTENRSLDDIGLHISQIGDSIDTYVAADYWAIEATVAPEHMDQLLELVYDLTHYPLFLEDELEKAKRIAIQTIRSRQDSPLQRGIDFYRDVFYPDYYASPDRMIQNLERVEREDTLDIYNSFFSPGNMVLSVSGNLNRDDVVRSVTASFGTHAAAARVREIKRQQPHELPAFEERQGGITQAGIIMGIRLDGFDRKDALHVEVVNALLDNSLGGRLFDEVREKSGLVYSISPYFSVRIQPYTWFILAATRKRNANRVVRVTKRVLHGLADNPPTEEELRLAKNYVATRLASSYQSPLRRAHYEAERLLRGEPLLNLDQRLMAIEDVNLEDILGFIDQYATGEWTTLLVR
jgi:predicted Zn-dependent peptidase